MNDEIREILEQLEWYRKIGKKDVYYPECVLPNKKAFILLDYITNLQQEIQKKEAMYDSLAVDYRLAQEENERLKENNQSYQEEMARTWKIADDYKSRVEKAVEYIKDIFKDEKWYENYEYNDLENALKNVLNILQNGSDDND